MWNETHINLWAYPLDVDWFRLEETLTLSEVVKPSKSHLGTSFTELSAEPLDSSESPEADPLKTALPKKVRSSMEKNLLKFLVISCEFAGHLSENFKM